MSIEWRKDMPKIYERFHYRVFFSLGVIGNCKKKWTRGTTRDELVIRRRVDTHRKSKGRDQTKGRSRTVRDGGPMRLAGARSVRGRIRRADGGCEG